MGVTMMFVVTGVHPIMKDDDESTKRKTLNPIKERKIRRKVGNDEVASVISSMMQSNPDYRCSMHESVVSVQLVAFNTWGSYIQ